MSKLIEAAEKGDLPAVRARLAAGDDVNAVDQFGATALNVASFHGHLDVVRELLKVGANVHAVNRDGTLLFIGPASMAISTLFENSFELALIPHSRTKKERQLVILTFTTGTGGCESCSKKQNEYGKQNNKQSLL